MNSLKQLYYTPVNAPAYSGAYLLVENTKRTHNKRKIREWLEEQDAYTMRKQIRHRYPRRPYTAFNIDDVWECDLVDLRSLKTYNNN